MQKCIIILLLTSWNITSSYVTVLLDFFLLKVSCHRFRRHLNLFIVFSFAKCNEHSSQMFVVVQGHRIYFILDIRAAFGLEELFPQLVYQFH